MNVLYTKYQSSDNLKLLRMITVIIVTVVLMVIGIRKAFIVPNAIALPVWLIGAMLVIVVGLLEIYKQLDIAKLYPIIAITLGLFFIFFVAILILYIFFHNYKMSYINKNPLLQKWQI